MLISKVLQDFTLINLSNLQGHHPGLTLIGTDNSNPIDTLSPYVFACYWPSEMMLMSCLTFSSLEKIINSMRTGNFFVLFSQVLT